MRATIMEYKFKMRILTFKINLVDGSSMVNWFMDESLMRKMNIDECILTDYKNIKIEI